MSELQRIRQDLARARERVAEIEAGKRGVRPAADWRVGDDADGGNKTGHGRAYENQLNAQRAAVARLELEYVHAMLPKWGAPAVIEAMERPAAKPAAPIDESMRLVVTRKDDPIRDTLRALLSEPGFYLSRSKLEELLQQ